MHFGENQLSPCSFGILPYPQLIPSLCNVNGFGPSRNVTFASAWPWVAHTVSGLLNATERPVQTRFRFGSGAERLNLATQSNSLAHSSIGTLSSARTRTPTVCRHTVSVLFHSPAWGAFHLSLTVLVHYRSLEVLSLGGWSPPDSDRISRVPPYSGARLRRRADFAYGAITLFDQAFQTCSAIDALCNSSEAHR